MCGETEIPMKREDVPAMPADAVERRGLRGKRKVFDLKRLRWIYDSASGDLVRFVEYGPPKRLSLPDVVRYWEI